MSKGTVFICGAFGNGGGAPQMPSTAGERVHFRYEDESGDLLLQGSAGYLADGILEADVYLRRIVEVAINTSSGSLLRTQDPVLIDYATEIEEIIRMFGLEGKPIEVYTYPHLEVLLFGKGYPVFLTMNDFGATRATFYLSSGSSRNATEYEIMVHLHMFVKVL